MTADDTLPVNTCLLKGEHEAHVWWYTSEGGGHMLSVPDPDAKGFKTHQCPGVSETAADDTVSDYEKGPQVADYGKRDDTVTAKLAEWEALVEGATAGPWSLDADGATGVYTDPLPHPGSSDVASAWRREDEAFIAAAPTIATALLGFVKEVRVALTHEPCADTCGNQLNEVYPCSCWKSTIERALTERIGGEG